MPVRPEIAAPYSHRIRTRPLNGRMIGQHWSACHEFRCDHSVICDDGLTARLHPFARSSSQRTTIRRAVGVG
jgi:hypothetical protein